MPDYTDISEVESDAPSESQSMTRWQQPRLGNEESSFPKLDTENAHKWINFLSKKPEYLANPLTQRQANQMFSKSAEVIKIQHTLDSLKNQTESAKIRNSMVEETTREFNELRKVDPISARELLDDDGNFTYSKDTAVRVGQLYKSIVVPTFEKRKSSQSALGKLMADREAAFAKHGEDSDEVGIFDSAIQQAISNKGRSIYMGMDNDGKPIFQMTEGGGKPIGNIGNPTVATQSKSQEKLLKYENSAELLNNLLHNLKPEHVGAQGTIGELLVDRTLAQFVPGAANKQRIETRTVLTAAREGLLREISDDPRFSNKDREEISKALPSSGVFESYPDAITRIKTVKQIISNRGKVYGSALGVDAPLWSLSKEEIGAKFKEGKITEEQALDALTRFH